MKRLAHFVLFAALALLDAPTYNLLADETAVTRPATGTIVAGQKDAARNAYIQARELDIQLFREWQQAKFAVNAAKSEDEKRKIMAELGKAQAERRKQLFELRVTARPYELEQQAAAARSRQRESVPSKDK
jgi:hypothetical protein